MAEIGCVTREEVLLVLRHCLGETAVKYEDGKVTIYAGDNPRVHLLPAQVSRRTISEFSHRYTIPVHLFYNAGMLHKAAKGDH